MCVINNIPVSIVFMCIAPIVTVVLFGSADVALDGDTFVLICKGNHHLNSYWTKGGEYFANIVKWQIYVYDIYSFDKEYAFFVSGGVHMLTIKNIKFEKDNDVIWGCRRYWGGEYAEYKVIVHAAPRLTIIEDTNSYNKSILICTAVGRPVNVTFFPWKHELDHQLVRQVEGYTINGSMYTLLISLDLQSDQGSYICSASNGIVNKMIDSVTQTTSFELITQAKPTIYPGDSINISVPLGETQIFTITFSSASASTFSWFHNNIKLIHPNKSIQIEEQTDTSHPYNTSIAIPATKVSLEIDTVKPSDRGTYEFRVCNGIGCSSYSYILSVHALQTNTQTSVDDRSTLIITGSVGAVSFIVVVAAVILVIVVFKRRRATKDYDANSQINNEFTDSNNTAPVEPIILENEMYISADLCREDVNVTEKQSLDEVHGSIKLNTTPQRAPLSDDTTSPNITVVNTNSTSDDNACAVYTVVNKTCKKDLQTQQLAGPLYGSVTNAAKPNLHPKIVNDKLSKTATQDGVQHKNNKSNGVNQVDQSDGVYYNISNEMVEYTDTTDKDVYINVPSTGECSGST